MSNLNLTEDIWDFCFNITKNKNSTQSDEATMFWVEGIGLSITSLIGILGNSMTVVVLNRISLNNVFNQVRIFICRQNLKGFYSAIRYSTKKNIKDFRKKDEKGQHVVKPNKG